MVVASAKALNSSRRIAMSVRIASLHCARHSATKPVALRARS
jgi:hypothetical protein